MAIEILEDIQPVKAFRGSCQAKENLRGKMGKNQLVAWSDGVVELIDDDEIVERGIDLFSKSFIVVNGLYGNKQVVCLFRGMFAVKQIAKVPVVQYSTEA